jgi:hypothetical protein
VSECALERAWQEFEYYDFDEADVTYIPGNEPCYYFCGSQPYEPFEDIFNPK